MELRISNGVCWPSGCFMYFLSSCITALSTLWKWWLMVSTHHTKKAWVERFLIFCPTIKRNLPTSSSTLTRLVGCKPPSLCNILHNSIKAGASIRSSSRHLKLRWMSLICVVHARSLSFLISWGIRELYFHFCLDIHQ